MTRRDFIALAETLQGVLAKHDNVEGAAAIYTVATGLCVVLKAQNPGFKRDVFLKACGFQEVSGDQAPKGITIQRGASK